MKLAIPQKLRGDDLFLSERKHRQILSESEALEEQISTLRRFFEAVPRLREEARLTVPSSEDSLPIVPEAPTRGELKRLHVECCARGLKLLLLAGFFFGAALWASERYTRLFGG